MQGAQPRQVLQRFVEGAAVAAAWHAASQIEDRQPRARLQHLCQRGCALVDLIAARVRNRVAKCIASTMRSGQCISAICAWPWRAWSCSTVR